MQPTSHRPSMTNSPCPFCKSVRPRVAENNLAFAIADGFPVSPGHTLIIPKDHVETVFDLSDEQYAACFGLVRAVQGVLSKQHTPAGFNIGVNCGEVAGQTVMHAHIHLIPRYAGDVPNPRGGIRHVIPGKGSY
jgi:diadenosine tetraphosphate (Ap4A) HIT family hydrolase